MKPLLMLLLASIGTAVLADKRFSPLRDGRQNGETDSSLEITTGMSHNNIKI